MKKNKKNAGRIVVITGASSGIGLRTKELFEQNGDIVVTLARTNRDNCDNFYLCDVSDDKNVEQVFSLIKEKFGKIDILVNNAGFGVSGAIELTPMDDIRKIVDVNIMGVVNCTKYALPLIGRGGKIINISSVCAMFPLPYRTFYCMTKSAVNSFSYGLKMECKPLGIEVGCVCPGDTKTNFTKNRVKIYETNARYGDRILQATSGIDSREDKRMSVDVVAKVVFNLSNRRSLPCHTIVGTKYKFLHFLMRFFPLSALIRATERLFGGHKKTKQSEKRRELEKNTKKGDETNGG